MSKPRIPRPPDRGKSSRSVVVAHLLDDHSGSARMCANAITAFQWGGLCPSVIVGAGDDTGFIREQIRPVVAMPYRLPRAPLWRLVRFAWIQLRLLVATMRLCLSTRADTVYVSTILPVGAAIGGRLCHARVVVHVHETTLGSPALFRLCSWAMKRLGHRFLCVSQYTRDTLFPGDERALVVYNALSADDWGRARGIAARRAPRPHDPLRVLMACSLKRYKGVDVFVSLAQKTAGPGSRFRFRLVLNCSSSEAREYFRQPLPDNLTLVFRPASMLKEYEQADVVLSLSDESQCIESFGLTLLEAMSCAVPVIRPTVGGCTELHPDGDGGWALSARNEAPILRRLIHLSENPDEWRRASVRAAEMSEGFHPSRFRASMLRAMEEH